MTQANPLPPVSLNTENPEASLPVPPGYFSVEGIVLATTAKAWLIQVAVVGNKELDESVRPSVWFPRSQALKCLVYPKDHEFFSEFVFPQWLCTANKLDQIKNPTAQPVNKAKEYNRANQLTDKEYDDDIPF